MKKVGEVRLLLSFFAVVVLVVAVDAMLMPILVRFYLQAGIALVLIYDFSVTLMAGWAGVFLARRVGSPLWWRSNNNSPVLRQKTYIIVLLSLLVVICNTVLNLVYYMAHRDQASQVSPWLILLTPEIALALSRARAQASLVIAGLASAMLVGLIHPGFVQAFLIGLALVYIYYKRGLLPAMIIHFLADAIPLVLISSML